MAVSLTIGSNGDHAKELADIGMGQAPPPPAPPADPAPAAPPAAPAPPAAVDPQARPKAKGAAGRIARLTRERDTAAQTAQQNALNAQNAAVLLHQANARIAELTARPPAATDPTVAPVVKTPAGPEPQEDAFETHTDWVKAYAKWTAQSAAPAFDEAGLTKKIREDILAEQAQRQAQTAQVDAGQRYAAAEVEARKRYADFDEAVDALNDIPAPPPAVLQAMGRAIHESEMGHDIRYYLATHLDDARRFTTMTDARQVDRAIGQIEERVKGVQAAAARPAAAPARPVPVAPQTRAPQPPPRLGQGSSVVMPDPAKMNYREYDDFRKQTAPPRR